MPEGGMPIAAGAASSAPVPLWQLHRRYVFAQTRQGLLIIDQHAAHERILYEEALARFEGDPPTTQQLLFPSVVALEPEEWEIYGQYHEDLPRLGIDTEEFGRQTVLLRGVPALWSHDPSGLFRELLEELRAPVGRRTSERMQRLAASFACRSAIRSGRSLTLDEMHALVDQLFATRVPHGDPHGRPTFVQIALADLDRRFGRH
jgi:DNA mismatch repair protein MutL